MSNYTCRLCGKTKDTKKEDWDYFADGVACKECLDKLEKELEKGDG